MTPKQNTLKKGKQVIQELAYEVGLDPRNPELKTITSIENCKRIIKEAFLYFKKIHRAEMIILSCKRQL